MTTRNRGTSKDQPPDEATQTYRAEKAKRASKSKAPATKAGKAKHETPAPEGSVAELPCLCGCGQETLTKHARFRPGHDAKLRKLLVEAALSVDALPEVARPLFASEGKLGNPVAGLILDTSRPGWLKDLKQKPLSKLSAEELRELADTRAAAEKAEGRKTA